MKLPFAGQKTGRHRRGSLVRQIMFLLFFVILVPVSLVGIFYYLNYRNVLYETAEQTLRDRALQEAEVIQGQIDRAEEALNHIQYSQEFLYFLDGSADPSDREVRRFRQSLQEEWLSVRSAYPNLFDALTVWTSGTAGAGENSWKLQVLPLLSANAPKPEAGQAEQIMWMGNIRRRDNSSAVAEITVENAELLVLPLYQAVRSISTEELIGIVELDASLDNLIDARTLTGGSQAMTSVILDRDGTVVYAAGGLASGTDALQEALKPELTVKSGAVTVAGTSCRYVMSEAGDAGLVCAMLLPEGEIVSGANRMIWKVGIAAAAAALLMLLITWRMIRGALDRLVVMDQAMERVEHGDFTVTLPADSYDDEITRTKERFRLMTERLDGAVRERIRQENAAKDAELRALQAQINPHFMFNIIETMRMQCEIDRYTEIGDALASLGQLMRYNMRWEGHAVPFRMEWEHLRNYLALMQLRLDDDLAVTCVCDDGLSELTVPKMFLQPLVENSFQHGFKGVPAPWRLSVRACRIAGGMRIEIRDNGSGIPEERLAELQEALHTRQGLQDADRARSSIGMVNVLQRMDMICGPDSEIRIGNGLDGGVEIDVTIVTGGEHVPDSGGR